MKARKDVKPRVYRSQLRTEQAQATRSRVIEAARELFSKTGYSATSIAAIGQAAGVSAETIYKSFGSKRAILSEMIDVALAGDASPKPVLERDLFRRVRDGRTQRERVARLAKLTRTILERAGPIHAIIRDASASDADASAIRAKHQRERLDGQTEFVRILTELGPLRRGMSLAEGADLYWTIASPELHHILTRERGWSQSRYEQWLADALEALLLPSAGASSKSESST